MNDKTPHYDLLIRGGTVIDGTKAPRFEADIGIVKDGRIAAIGELADHTADQTLDATRPHRGARLHRLAHPRRPGRAVASRWTSRCRRA
jgi:hypothetical protein